MKPARLCFVTFLAMLCFAGNSLLCRVALRHNLIDAASFTFVRVLSGAVMLLLIATIRRKTTSIAGNWPSAFALSWYAGAFSFAYISLPAGTGALLLFGAVQATMILWGLRRGESVAFRQIIGLMLALAGLIGLVLPGVTSPPPLDSAVMITAGIAWGIYSLRGKGVGSPVAATAGNFLRTLPLTACLSLLMFRQMSVDNAGLVYAALSGALTSGIGYAIWYQVLPSLRSTTAATVQLSVPVIAALGGVLMLGESLSWRLALASLAILGGIALVILEKRPAVEP